MTLGMSNYTDGAGQAAFVFYLATEGNGFLVFRVRGD